MILEEDILALHEYSVRDFGGAADLRDRDLLLSAIARPYQTFDGKDLYATPYEKAAALGESLIINHPFLDGNKRTAFLAMLALLYEHKIEFCGDDSETYNFVIAMSAGEKDFDLIVDWLIRNSK